MQPLLGTQPEHQFQDCRISGDPLRVLHRIGKAGRRHHLEALVHPDKEVRWNDRTLDRAELRTLDLPWDRTQLARSIDIGLYADGRIALDRSGVVSRKFVC